MPTAIKTEQTPTEWMPDAPLLLTIEQTAALLNLSCGTVKNLLARRELVRRKIGGLTRIPRSSVEAFTRKDHETLTDEQKEKRRRKPKTSQ
jgi:excisionase family DNA binding protein